MTIGRIPSVEGGIQPTIVDAKGDLIAGVAADSVNRLAVGTNGTVLTADSSTSTGLAWTGVNQMANPIINGGMDIWQRGTSFSITSGSQSFLTCDRWWGYRGATGGTISRQNTSDSTNLPNIQYCARVQRDNGNTSTTAISIVQSLESVNSIPFAGRTVTLSLYARAGANFSASSSALNVQLLTGTGTDQNVINAYTGVATPINQNVTLTTTWQRFAISATIPTTTTEFAISVQYTPTGTAGANDWFEVTGVQIDLGTYTASSAPTFRRSGGTLAGELQACQRYYYRLSASAAYNRFIFGAGNSATNVTGEVYPPTVMRIAPTAVDYSTLAVADGVNAPIAVTNVVLNDAGNAHWGINCTSTGITNYRPYTVISNNSTSAYLGFSAEL